MVVEHAESGSDGHIGCSNGHIGGSNGHIGGSNGHIGGSDGHTVCVGRAKCLCVCVLRGGVKGSGCACV